MLSSWSHSRLTEFEKCKYRTFLLHVKRIPEPARPLPPGKTEQANDRGTRIHDAAEQFIVGKTNHLDSGLKYFGNEFEHLRRLYRTGIVTTEEEWGFDHEWHTADWKTAWHRSKLDAMVHTGYGTATIIDFKTGAKFGNEVKHGEQLQLYSLDAFQRFPELEEVTAELWYLDHDDLVSRVFQREQALKFRASFEKRGIALTTCVDWPPNPNIFVCRYCRYGETGDCKVSANTAYIKRARPVSTIVRK